MVFQFSNNNFNGCKKVWSCASLKANQLHACCLLYSTVCLVSLFGFLSTSLLWGKRSVKSPVLQIIKVVKTCCNTEDACCVRLTFKRLCLHCLQTAPVWRPYVTVHDNLPCAAPLSCVSRWKIYSLFTLSSRVIEMCLCMCTRRKRFICFYVLFNWGSMWRGTFDLWQGLVFTLRISRIQKRK